MTLPSTPHLAHNTHGHFFAMPTPSIYLRTPDATPGSFVKLLWDFTCSTMSATHPPQYELLKSRITPSTSKYWAVVHIPPAKTKPRPNGSLLHGEIYADSANGHRSGCTRSSCSPSIRGTLCQRTRVLLLSEPCCTRRSNIFSRWTN